MLRRLSPVFATALTVAGCTDIRDSTAPDFEQLPAATNAGAYTIIKVDRIDMGAGRAFAINDNGVAAGYASGQSGDQVFKWTKANGMQFAGVPGQAFDINNSGDIVGRSGLHAFLRWSGGLVTDLGTLSGGNDSDAYALNNWRHIAGRSDNATSQRAFRWIPPGPMQDLHAFFFNLPHAYSAGLGINKEDHVVGWAQDGFIKDAFRWTPAGGVTILADLGGSVTRANDINDSGVIVGQAQGMINGTPFGDYYAVKWSSNAITLLSAGGSYQQAAHSVNKNGYIAGLTDALGPTLWRPNGNMVALGQLPGGSGAVAQDVNLHLEIVGSGLDANFITHAIYWKVTFYNYTLSALAPWAQPSSPPPYITLGDDRMMEVAILSDPRFDASRLDPSLFTMGDWRGTDTRIARDPKGTPHFSLADVDRDGDVDLVLQFEQAALERNGDLTAATTELIVSADLGQGEGIYGRNAVRVLSR